MFEPKQKIFDNIQWPYFMVMHVSRIFKALSGFKMSHFEAYFNSMTGGTSICWTVNMKMSTRTVQSEANNILELLFEV